MGRRNNALTGKESKAAVRRESLAVQQAQAAHDSGINLNPPTSSGVPPPHAHPWPLQVGRQTRALLLLEQLPLHRQQGQRACCSIWGFRILQRMEMRIPMKCVNCKYVYGGYVVCSEGCCSVLLLTCSITIGALESPSLLSSCSIITNNNIIAHNH